MNRVWQRWPALLLALANLPAVADPVAWRSEAEDSELRFAARYEGEEIPGRFTRFDVQITTESAGGAPRGLVVEVAVRSADMNDPEINEELSEPDWFDAGSFPVARFESDEIRRSPEGYVAAGRLRIKDIEHALTVPFTWQRIGRGAVLSGSLGLSRLAWAIGSGEWASDVSLEDRVQLAYSVSLLPAE
jgi:polyisoprenoid-binding protein YceI